MGCRIIADDTATCDAACFYCSTSGIAFGPTFDSREEGEAFLAYCFEWRGDPRSVPVDELVEEFARWVTARRDEARKGDTT